MPQALIHLVLLRFRVDITDVEITSIFNELRVLTRQIGGISNFVAGSNCSPEGFSQNFNHAFIMKFKSEADRDTYLVHPKHQKLAAKLIDSLEDGPKGLLVIDISEGLNVD